MKNTPVSLIWSAAAVFAVSLAIGATFSVCLRDWTMLLWCVSLGFVIAASGAFVEFLVKAAALRLGGPLARHWRACAIAGGVTLALRLALPCAVRGNWVGDFTAHLCADHAFLRFSDGQIAHYHGDLWPRPLGTYHRVGWNSYQWKSSPEDKCPVIVHVGWFFLSADFGTHRYWFHRDLNLLEASSMVRKARARTANPSLEPTAATTGPGANMAVVAGGSRGSAHSYAARLTFTW